MLPYAAYLRIYEPLYAFSEPGRTAWAAYAAAASCPSRADALDVEHAHAMRRLIAVPPIVAPVRESREAYVRRREGMTYVCPWQTRLRSWLAFSRFQASRPARLLDTFLPRPMAEQVQNDFTRWKEHNGSLHPYILSSTWHVPAAWLVAFDQAERCLVLGGRQDTGGGGSATAAPPRTLIYVTAMAQARRRVARALWVIRRNAAEGLANSDVETVGRWLEEFHPHSLVELDYGGLVHLMDDEALRSDQSVAEMSAALTGLETGQMELAKAMCTRLRTRWRAVRTLESAN